MQAKHQNPQQYATFPCILKSPPKTPVGIAPAPELKTHWLSLDLSTGLHAMQRNCIAKRFNTRIIFKQWSFTSTASEVCNYCIFAYVIIVAFLYNPLHVKIGMWWAIRYLWRHQKKRKRTWNDTLRPQADTRLTTGNGAIRLKALYVVKFWTPFAHTSPTDVSRRPRNCKRVEAKRSSPTCLAHELSLL